MKLAAQLLTSTVFLCLCTFAFAESEQTSDPINPSKLLQQFPTQSPDGLEDELTPNERIMKREQEAELALTQEELRQKKQAMLGVHMGTIYPWHHFGLSMLWWDRAKRGLWGLSLGSGSFELSDVRQGRAFFLDSQIKSLWGSYRRYLGSYPFFWEAYSGLEVWNAELRPRTNEQQNELEAASLISDFSGMSVGLGGKVGFIWHWENGIFIESSILHAGMSRLLAQKYTNNTPLARDMVRNQVETFRTWGSINFKLGYRLH